MPLTDSEPLIDIDEHYVAEVLLKRNLLTELPTYYFQAQPGYELAQWDVVERVLTQTAHITPDAFTLRRSGNQWTWENHRLGEELTFTFGDGATLPLEPLDWVGRQVADDLLVLAGDTATLVAGQLCFGNGWCLNEKMGLPFWDIHAPITPIPALEPMMQKKLHIRRSLTNPDSLAVV